MDAQLIIALGGLAGVITALAGAYITLSKRRPEVARVFIESAGELVVTQSKILKEATEAYEAMHRRVVALEKRSAEQEQIQRVATVEIEELQRELSNMHDEMAQLTRSRDQAKEELEDARHEVDRLRARVQLLEETLKAQDIPVPEGEGEPSAPKDIDPA